MKIYIVDSFANECKMIYKPETIGLIPLPEN